MSVIKRGAIMNAKLIITDLYYKANNAMRDKAVHQITVLHCAKNEKPSFIAIVDTFGKAARLISDDSPNLGITPLLRYRISINGFKSVVHPIGYLPNNDGIKVADIVFNKPTMEYSGDERIIALCELNLNSDIKAGEYRFCVNLYSSNGLNDEELIDTEEITLLVYDCELPKPSNYTLYTDIWQHNSNIARTFGVELWSDEHFLYISKVLDKLIQLGQKSMTLVVSDCPWRGWGCYLMRDFPANMFEYSIINTSRDVNGNFIYDYSAMDRYIELCLNKCINGDITLYGLIGIWKMPYFNTKSPEYPETVKIRYLDNKDGAYRYMTTRDEIVNYISSLFTHLKEKGLWDMVRIGADEPSMPESFIQNLDILKSIDSDIKLKLAIDKPEIIDTLGKHASDIAYSFPCTLKTYQKSGLNHKKLWYVCNIPDRPNSLLDSPSTDTVALGILNHVFGFDGFLRWAFTSWTTSPLSDIRYNINGLPAGDMCLVYPDTQGDILESLRFIQLKHGILMYELLNIVKSMDIEKYHSLIGSVIGAKDKYLNIADDISISSDSRAYAALYTSLLEYLANVSNKEIKR